MIEWSDEAIAAALRVWLRLSEVGEFRDVRWRETMRQALMAAVEAQNRPDVMGDALAKALIRATDLEIEAYHLKIKNEKLREALKPFAGILKGNYSHQSDDMPIKAGANQYDLVFVFTLGDLRAAAAAIREGGKDE